MKRINRDREIKIAHATSEIFKRIDECKKENDLTIAEILLILTNLARDLTKYLLE